MSIGRISFEHYNYNDVECIRQYNHFYHRVYRVTSKCFPHGVASQEALRGIEECEQDYKEVGTMARAISILLGSTFGRKSDGSNTDYNHG